MNATQIRVHDAPSPAGPYSQGLRTGDFVFVSGQVPRQPDGTYEPNSIADETRLTLLNLQAVARGAGADINQAVKVTAYLATLDDVAEFDAVYGQFFTEPRPARTTVAAGLRDVKVEIDAIFYAPQ